jgi:hypothetical protein
MRAARAWVVAAVIAMIAPAGVARAAGSGADRDAARNLAGKGYELLEAGQYGRAIEVFQQAEARYHAPSHLLYIARAQVKLGKLLDAEASYQRLADEKLAADAPRPFREAQVTARAEIAEVRARIPSLTIVVEGDAPAGTRIVVDGQPVDPRALGTAIRHDPGVLLVTAEAPGAASLSRTVILPPGGGDVRVALPFPRTLAYVVPAVVSLGLGAVGLGVGVAAAILSPRAQEPGRGRLRAAEIAGFAVGGAGVVAGVVLLAVRPRSATAAGAAPVLRVGLGVGTITLGGAF